MKQYIVVTGGAGFVGSNLIEFLIKKTKLKIISIDNYSTGRKINEVKNKRVTYIKGNTKNISKILNKKKKKLIQFFILENFQEFIKALKNLMSVLNLILLAQMQFLNFVWIIILNLFIQQLLPL